jgi:hypothetical protein
MTVSPPFLRPRRAGRFAVEWMGIGVENTSEKVENAGEKVEN